jgi:hypothetical protein
MSAEKDLFMSAFAHSPPTGYRFGSMGPSSAHHVHPAPHSVYAPTTGGFYTCVVSGVSSNKKVSVAQKFWSARVVPTTKRRVRLCMCHVCSFLRA